MKQCNAAPQQEEVGGGGGGSGQEGSVNGLSEG